jgi:hypothetical protein
MPLTLSEKERTRYHLGYLNVSPAAAISYGMVRPIQTLFLVEEALNHVIEDSVDRVRRIIRVMDDIELKLVDAQDRLAADALGDLKIRATEPDQLDREYYRWGMRLADLLGVPPYYLSPRYRNSSGVAAGNVPVR